MSNEVNIFDYDKPSLVIGLGLSGYSCVKFLAEKNCPITVLDTREVPPFLDDIKANYPEIAFISSKINEEQLESFEQIIVSPGISPRDPALVKAQQSGKLIIGDLNLFIQENHKTNTPIIAVTGSNGKSTVVTLLAHIINQCDKTAMAGGNIGLPLLELLKHKVDYYIIELSSFQLETFVDTNYQQKPFISSTVLNVSEDHMDRYDDIQDYRETKERIYSFSDYQIINKLDNHYQQASKAIYFTENVPLSGEYGLIDNNNSIDISAINKESNKSTTWANSKKLKIKGRHNYVNVAATLALLEPLNLDKHKIQQSLITFEGLEHRCQWVAEIADRVFYNDSKGTNVGATIAAINSFDNDIILIAGGVGKDADFTPLGKVIAHKVKALVLIGQDAKLIKIAVDNALAHHINYDLSISMADTLHEAVKIAYQLSTNNAIILFSPACASFDMFANYVERGQKYVKEVKELANNLLVHKESDCNMMKEIA